MKKILSLALAVIMMLSMWTVALAATSDASISNKKELYKQYQAAVEEARVKYNASIELRPFEKFDFSIAAPIEEFKATLKAFGESQMNAPKFDMSNALTAKEYAKKVSEIQPMAFVTKTKSTNVKVGTKSVKINITAKIDKYHNDIQDRMLISSDSYISSIKSATSGYTWNTEALDTSLIDGGRTFYMEAQGNVEYSNTTWKNLSVSMEYYCSATGKIS